MGVRQFVLLSIVLELERREVMAFRNKIGSRSSKRMFSKHADKVHKKNLPVPRRNPMRGGIRL